MDALKTTKFLLMTTVFAVMPYRLEVDLAGKIALVPALAEAKSGSGSDGDGGDDGEGGDDGGEGGDDGGDDGDDGGEGGDDGDDGGDDGDDGGEGGDDGDDDGGEGDDDGDDGDDDGGESDDDSDSDDDDSNDDDSESNASRSTSKGDDKTPRPTRVQKLRNGARVIFSDGSREEVKNGQFVRTDHDGRVLERRRARSSDLARMRALFGGKTTETDSTQSGVNSRAVKATYRGRNVEILYSNGWREEISRGRYMLIDQFGRVAASRRATQEDRNRLNRFRNQ